MRCPRMESYMTTLPTLHTPAASHTGILDIMMSGSEDAFRSNYAAVTMSQFQLVTIYNVHFLI